MKRKIYVPLLTAILVMSGITLSAQDSPFKFGIKGGLNLSYLSIDREGIPKHNVKPGPNIGVAVTYPLSELLSIQSGLSVASKGTKIEGKAPMGFEDGLLYATTDAGLTSQQWYLQVPVLLEYGIRVSTETKILVNAGPYFAWGFAGKTKLTGDIIYGDMIEFSTLDYDTFGDRGLERYDAGIAAGIGIDLGEVIIGLNYELGLRDIGPKVESFAPFYYSSSYKNRNVFLSFEHRF